MGDKQSFSDRAIGVVVGFVLILVVAKVVGVPWEDLAIWAVVFLVVGGIYLAFLRRRLRK